MQWLETFQVLQKKKWEHTIIVPKVTVYTAIIDDYDILRDPLKPTPGYDYICFTNSKKEIKSDVWKVVTIHDGASPPLSPTKLARFVKTHPHGLLPDADIAIWCDANIWMKGDISELVDEFNETYSDFSAIKHPHRDCLYEEAETCKRLGKDDPETIANQIALYQSLGFPERWGLIETGFFITRPKVAGIQKAFDIWWKEIQAGSHRDQISVMFAFKKANELIVPFRFSRSGMSVRNHPLFSHFQHGDGTKAPRIKQRQKKNLKTLDPKPSPPSPPPSPAMPKSDPKMDIIICVHNALPDLERCMHSLKRADTSHVNKFIVVNDKSDYPTTRLIKRFEKENLFRFLYYENKKPEPIGYTRAANAGLRLLEADAALLLNSDTIVPKKALSKLYNVLFNTRSDCGIVGPLSNAAGPQSIPSLKKASGNSAINMLPKNVTADLLDVQAQVWAGAQPNFPIVPLIHGFCMGIKRGVINTIGLFDEKSFPRGYGEENDYCLRARAAGYTAAVAVNAFVYHAKSKSYNDEIKRNKLMRRAALALNKLYGADWIKAHEETVNHPELVRIRTEAYNFWRRHNDNTNRRRRAVNTVSRLSGQRTRRKR